MPVWRVAVSHGGSVMEERVGYSESLPQHPGAEMRTSHRGPRLPPSTCHSSFPEYTQKSNLNFINYPPWESVWTSLFIFSCLATPSCPLQLVCRTTGKWKVHLVSHCLISTLWHGGLGARSWVWLNWSGCQQPMDSKRILTKPPSRPVTT